TDEALAKGERVTGHVVGAPRQREFSIAPGGEQLIRGHAELHRGLMDRDGANAGGAPAHALAIDRLGFAVWIRASVAQIVETDAVQLRGGARHGGSRGALERAFERDEDGGGDFRLPGKPLVFGETLERFPTFVAEVAIDAMGREV